MSKAPLVGTAGGATAGFFLGGPVGAALGAAIGFLGGKRYEVVKGMTPEQKKIYEEALKTLKDPTKLRKLADEFERNGFKDEADLLRKRAALRELPPEQKAIRREAFRKAISVGKDGKVTQEQIDRVKKMAHTFHLQGATGNAAALLSHATGLQKLIGK